MTFTGNHLLLWQEPACVENAAYKRAGEDGAEQGEESTPTWNAVAAGCLPQRIWRVFRPWFPGPGGKWKKDQKDSTHPPHALLHYWPVPMFPAFSLAFCYKQALNHLLLKAGGEKQIWIKQNSKAELLIKSFNSLNSEVDLGFVLQGWCNLFVCMCVYMCVWFLKTNT